MGLIGSNSMVGSVSQMTPHRLKCRPQCLLRSANSWKKPWSAAYWGAFFPKHTLRGQNYDQTNKICHTPIKLCCRSWIPPKFIKDTYLRKQWRNQILQQPFPTPKFNTETQQTKSVIVFIHLSMQVEDIQPQTRFRVIKYPAPEVLLGSTFMDECIPTLPTWPENRILVITFSCKSIFKKTSESRGNSTITKPDRRLERKNCFHPNSGSNDNNSRKGITCNGNHIRTQADNYRNI